ncbi:hypothetical protein D3C86_1300160 [compost metagenome]
MHVRIGQITAEMLEGGRLLRGDAHMAHLHLRACPGVHEFMGKRVRMTITVDRLVDLLAAWRGNRPENHAHLLARRHAYGAAQ